ncbi:MAG: GNAT family protein [Steroidobacteraceae bacterium]
MTTLNELGQPVGAALPHWSAPPVPPRTTLAGRYCTLEPLDTRRHAASLFEANRADVSGQMWTYLTYGPFATLQAYSAWMDSVIAGSDPLFFAIVAADGCALGIASYLRIDPRNGSIEVGSLAYSPQLQRSRIATKAMFLLMQQAFALGYRRYEWKCNALNHPSRASALRLGFTFEGVFRQAMIAKGRNRDTAWFSIIDGEWPQLCAAFECWLAPETFGADGTQRARLADLIAAALRTGND